LDRFLPSSLDNTWRGPRLALWLFGLLVFVKLGVGINSIFRGSFVAGTADSIPLASYTPAGARTVVAMMALLGVSQLMMCFLGVLALVRYRTLIPLLYAIFLLEYTSKRLVFHFLPIERTGAAPGQMVNYAMLTLMIVGLVLSLRSNR
jgi:hypothetical protein